MNRQATALGVLALLLVCSIVPSSSSDAQPSGRATMYTTATRFDDNSTRVQMNFLDNGSNSSMAIMIPAAALMRMATVEIKGNAWEKPGSFRDDTTGDFLGGVPNNISVQNGSLVLKPLLNQTPYNVGSSPAGLAAGDVNYDGHVELLVANSGGNTVGVLAQNRSHEKYEAQVTYAVGQSPQGMAVGDLNNDGRQDVAVACSGTGALNVLLQKQDGTLAAAVSYQSGSGTRALAIGDFDFDGRDDIVTVNPADSTMTLFLQNATGALESKGTFATGTNPFSIAAGDVNLDGRDEAVVANKDSSTISVFVQERTSWMALSAVYNVGPGPVSVAVGDVNRDGLKDVVVAGQTVGAIGILYQNASGGLASRVEFQTAGPPNSVAIGDLNFDGRLDIASSSADGNLSVLWQRYNGNLTPHDDYRAGATPAAVVISDLNSDGKGDLAVANSGDSTVGVLRLRPFSPGKLNAMTAYNVGQAPIGLARGDLNTDGLDDLLVGNALSGSVGALLQARTGQLNAQTSYSLGTPLGVAVCDLDHDGRDDIVIADQGGTTQQLVTSYQMAAGDFSATPVTYPVNLSLGLVYIVACGDLNSDGWPDIAVTSANDGVYPYTEPDEMFIFVQNGSTRRFDDNFMISCPGPRGVAMGDVNSDGRNDLCVASSTSDEMWVYHQNPNGTLSYTPVKYVTDSGPHGLRIGDLNADGRNDVVVANWNANNVNVFLQGSSGTLGQKVAYGVVNSGVDVEIGDYDSDGLSDLAVSHYNTINSISVLNQTRQGTFSSYVTYASGQSSAYLASGDLNGDGKADLGVANQASNNIGLYLQKLLVDMNGTYTSQFRQLPYEVVEATAYWNMSGTAATQNGSVELSNDRGATWTKARAGEAVEFTTGGTTIGYRARLASAALNLTPSFENISVDYIMRSHPVDPSLDIGGAGTAIWNWTGPFGLSGIGAVIDFTARLNATLQSVLPGPDGKIRVPFIVASGSLGTISLQNLSVQYDLAPSAPVLKELADGEFTTDPEPSFKLAAQDNDTDVLKFKIELSRDNFSNIKSIYNQRTSAEGWDKESYNPGETATFHIPHADRLTADGLYQWRAFVWDETVWSAPSRTGAFRLDTRAPTARVQLLPAYENTTQFIVAWNGTDPEPGSGLNPDATFDIQYKDRDSSPWTDWFIGTNQTQAEFLGVHGKTYFFQARARDLAGNVGQYTMGFGDTRTVVDVSPPAGMVSDDGSTTSENTRLHATFSFSDVESGVVRYSYWIGTQPGADGNDTYGPASTDKKEITVQGLFLKNGTRYYFTVMAENGAGIWSAPVSTDGILVRLKVPVATLSYDPGARKDGDIELSLGASDPNNAGILQGNLEVRVANVQNRAMVNWSDWKPVGATVWDGPRPGPDPYIFTGEPGKAYRFRYRVKDRAEAFSDYADPGNITRINRPPVPVIFGPAKGKAGSGIEFGANGSHDPDGDQLAYTWDFGDGKMGFGREQTHIYSQGNKYCVTLYVDDSIENVSIQMTVRVSAGVRASTSGEFLAAMVVAVVASAAGGAFALIARRRRRVAPAPPPGPPGTSPYIVPGSDRPAPPPQPLTAAEVDGQIAAAREVMAELEQLGVETSRTTKMLGLASSFLADGNLEMASQYARKTAKLARDQKQRKESEVDEETARRFVNETQRMLDRNDAAGLNVKEAKKLFGLSISFLAEGNYVTGMQYSKKVRRIIEDMLDRQAALPVTGEGVDAEMEFLKVTIAELRRAGDDTEAAEKELEMARLFFKEKDYQPAMDRVLKARSLVQDLKEKGRPFTAQQWKEKLNQLKLRVEREKDEGLRTEEPMKMLKFSESFALQGNLEVASQYIRKAEMLLNDMGDRARVDAQRREGPVKATLSCPRCGEEVEPDWMVCAFCNARLKADRPAGPAEGEHPDTPAPGETPGSAGTEPAGGTGAAGATAVALQAPPGSQEEQAAVAGAIPAVAAPASPGPASDEGRASPPSGAPKVVIKPRTPGEIRVAKPVEEPEQGATGGDGALAKKEVKVAHPIGEVPDTRPGPKRCPQCGLDLEPGWSVCPACEFPLEAGR